MHKTHEEIYKEFCEKYPMMSKDVVRYRPWGGDEIMLWLKSGERMTYGTEDGLVHLKEA